MHMRSMHEEHEEFEYKSSPAGQRAVGFLWPVLPHCLEIPEIPSTSMKYIHRRGWMLASQRNTHFQHFFSTFALDSLAAY